MSQPSQCLPGSDVIDLIGESGKDLDAYFDRREFEIRSWLEDQHYWHRYRKTVILQILQGHSTDRRRPLVNLGCGAGVVATHLNQHGYRVDYADVHTEALQVARQRFQATMGSRAPAPRFIRVDIDADEAGRGRPRAHGRLEALTGDLQGLGVYVGIVHPVAVLVKMGRHDPCATAR